jgi:hypothetical protein
MGAAAWQSSWQAFLNGPATFGPMGASSSGDTRAAAGFVSVPGVISSFTITIDDNDRNQEQTASLLVNGVATATVTIPPLATGPFQDITTTVDVVRGDELQVYFDAGTGESGNFATLGQISLQFAALNGTTVTRFTASGATSSIATSAYVMPIGQFTFSINEDPEFHVGSTQQPGTLGQASVFVRDNMLEHDMHVVLRVNRADTAIVVTIPAGENGWFHDTVHTVPVDGSQTVNWSIVIDPADAHERLVHLSVLQIDFATLSDAWAGGVGNQARNVGAGDSLFLSWGGLNTEWFGGNLLPLDTTILALGAFVNASQLGATLTFVVDGVDSSLVLSIPQGFTGYIRASGTAIVPEGALCTIRVDVQAGVGVFQYYCVDFVAGTNVGVLGPLAWVHITRRTPDGSLATDTYSDQDMACPGSWENGFKAGQVTQFGTIERSLSDRWSGEWTGATCRVSIADPNFRLRQQLAGTQNRYWTRSMIVKITDRATRAALGEPFTVFVGPPIEITPTRPLGIDVTGGDIVSRSLLDDANQIPWRYARDGIVGHLTTVASNFDYETPEPIIYGQHIRTTLDPHSSQGYIYPPTYLGVLDTEHVWLIAGHACKDIPNVWVDDGDGPVSVLGDVGTDWRVNHQGGSPGEPAYYDYRSIPYGNDRRYTLIFGTVGNDNPDACASGEKTLFVSVYGIESKGDGTGTIILDRLQQYKHFAINFIAHHGRDSYQSGKWLSNPFSTAFGAPVTMVDADSFDRASGIAQIRYPVTTTPNPAGGFYPAGYLGAAIIGAHAGDRASVRRWIAEWNRSCAVRNGDTRLGRYRVVMPHPTQAVKDAAPLYTDATEIVRDSFGATLVMSEQANRVPFRTDYEYRSGAFKTTGMVSADASVSNYEREITADPQEYPYAPGITMAYQVAYAEVLQRAEPPRQVTLRTFIGPDAQGGSLGYRELGDFIRYRAYPAVANDKAEIRLAMIEKMIVDPSARTIAVQAIDMEDLIDFDLPPATGVTTSPINDGCSAATVLDPGSDPDAPVSNVFTGMDTTDNATDASVAALLPAGFTAYKAFWAKITPVYDGHLFVTTFGSNYDTHLSIFTGSCGSLAYAPADGGSPAADAFNDNDGLLLTSILEIPVTSGTDYFILVASVHDDGGLMDFGAQVFVPAP